MTSNLHQLEQTLMARKNADASTSYVASLYHAGLNKILEKVGEEATETLLAAKDHTPGNPHLVKETADLWFHSMVMLAHLNIPLDDVLTELHERTQISGLTEKANRSKPSKMPSCQ